MATHPFWLLAVLLFGLNCSPVKSSFLGCYEDNVGTPAFYVIPAGCDIGQMTSDWCKAACRQEGYQYAGVNEGHMCACAQDIAPLTKGDDSACATPCTGGGHSTNECGGPGSLYSVFDFGPGGGQISQVTLSMEKEKPTIDDVLDFSIGLGTGSGVSYTLDYGDNCPETISNATGLAKHHYVVPGEYTATITAQADGLEQVETASTAFQVGSLLSDSNSLDCPPAELTRNTSSCTVIVFRGQDVQLSIDQGDGSGLQPLTTLDVPVSILGAPCIPQVESSNIMTNPHQTALIIPRNSLVTQKGFITHFELQVAQEKTALTITINRPKCPDNTPFCVDAGKCASVCPQECPEGQPFDMSTGTCQSSGPTISGSPPLTYVHVGYSIKTTLSKVGYKLLTQKNPIEVLPGDVVTFATGPGTLAYSEVDEAESDETGSLNGAKTKTGKRYMFRVVVAEPASVDVEHTYSKSGIFQFSINLENSITPATKTNTTPISVQEPITGLKVVATPQFVEAMKPTTIRTTLVAGSLFSLFWEFGDEDVLSTDHTDILAQPFTQLHNYKKEGIYKVSVNASNAFGSETDSCDVIVQWPVTTNWQINTSSPDLLPPGVISVELKYTGDSSALPTNVSFLINWGDQEPPENITLKPKTAQHVFKHIYKLSGNYEVKAILSNHISTYTLTANVLLMNVIKLIQAKPYSKDDKTKEKKAGSGKFFNTFGSKKDIFVDVQDKGPIDGYIVELENGTLIGKYTKDPGIKFKIDKDGTHNLKIYGYNKVEKKSIPYLMTIEISGALQHIFITDFDVIRDKNETKNFRFSFDAFPAGTCMFVEYGDGTAIETYGDEDWCKKNMSGGAFTGELTNPLNTTHIYEKRGIYDIFAKACTPTSCTAANFEFTVTLMQCTPAPTAKIQDAYTMPAVPKKNIRSKPLRIKTVSKIQCSVEVDIKRWWQIFKIDPYNLTVMETIPIEDTLASWNKSLIVIPKCFLEFGLYKLQYTTSIGYKPPPVSKYQKSKRKVELPPPYVFSRITYVEIVVSPLVPILIKGAMTEVIRGYGQEVAMEAAKLSFDPDYPTSNVFSVDWYCNRIDSEIPNDELTGPAPKYDKSNLVNVLPPTGNHSHEDKGGCFGTGPGLVNHTDSNWVLDTFSLYRKNLTFNITAIIRRDIRVVSAWLIIRVVNGMPPTIDVACLIEELCMPTPRGLLINPNYRLALKGSCGGDCPAEPIFTWSVLSVNMDHGLNKTKIHGIESYMMTDDEKGSEYALNETFFTDRTDVSIFGFELQIAGGDELGQAGLFIRINNAPKKGSCKIELSPDNTRPEGYALFSLWTIKCSDWMDPDDNEINKYSYFVKQEILDSANDSLTWKFNLMFDSTPEVTVILPCGEQTVAVEIYDELGAFTEYDVKTFTPELPPYEEFKKFKKSHWMKGALAVGDQARLIQMVQAVSSMEHCYTHPDLGNLTEEERKHLEEERLMEEAEEKTELLDGMIHSATVEDMDDMVLISNAVTSVLGTGHDSDGKERDLAVEMIGNLDLVLNHTDVAAPEAMLDLAKNMLQVVGAVIEGDTETVKSGHVAPSDLEHIDDIYYDTEVEEDFEMPENRDDMLRNAIVDAQKQKSEEHIGSIDGALATIQEKMFHSMAVNEQMFTVDTKSTAAAFAVLGGNESIRETPELGDASFHLPNTCVLMNLTGENCNDTIALGISTVTSVGIMNSGGKGLNLLANDTSTVKIEVFNAGDNQDNTKLDVGGLDDEPIDVVIPKGGEGQVIERAVIVPKMKWFEYMVYHQVVIDKSGSALSVEISAVNASSSYVLFFRKQKKPTLWLYDFMVNLEQENNPDNDNVYKLFFESEQIGNATGVYYLGVSQLTPEAASAPYNKEENYTKEHVTRNFTSNYTFLMYTSGCYYYDEFYKEWKGDGCKVSNATPALTHCKCTHLTTFAGGFFVMPNTIDFAYVFANASFADNLTIYVTIIVTVVIYILLLIWARRKDRRDRDKLGALPLPDNNPGDKYFYEILVFTGHTRNASTESKVSFVLSGDKDETEVRTFGTQSRKVFCRDGVDVFVMAAPRPLGQLQFLRIWHDNSGKGPMASWYLNYVMVRDVQTGEKFDFISDSWFAVEEDDGQIDRVIPVAGKEQLTEFSHLFNTTSRKNLSDGHIWFSVFLRPPRSRFTRSQRVSTCMALLYLSMLANCMWYGTVPDNPKASALKFGPFSVGLEQISIGFMSNIIIFPPSFFIVFLFRKSRPRKLRPSRIDQALNKQKDNVAPQTSLASGSKRPQTQGGAKPAGPLYKRPKRFTLPWWCKIVGWILCFACMGVSIFFLWAYGITFGNEKTKKWLTSLLLSFFMSILITQPIKVFFLAMLFSAICKNVNTDEDDADEDEDDPTLHFDEEWLLASNDPTKPRKSGYKSEINDAAVEEARMNRLKEVKMFQILRELFGYFMFLWILATVGYSSRDPYSFFLRKTLVNSFIDQRIPGVGDFHQITTEKDFWNWASNVLMPNIRFTRTYSNEPPFGMKGFLKDGVNRMLGFGIIRQIRMKPGECQLAPQLQNMSTRCSGAFTNIVHEDKSNYDIGWRKITMAALKAKAENAKTFKEEKVKFGPWTYVRSHDIQGNPTVTSMGIYSGGGYIVELRNGTIETILKRFGDLERYNWIDRFTRAIFIEFSIFNAQANMFGIVQIYLEFVPGGGIISDYKIHTLTNIKYNEGLGKFLLVIQILFVICIIYFTVRELIKICKGGCREYFKQFWNWIEMCILLTSYAAIAAFVIRMVIVQKAIALFNKTKGNKYINLQYPHLVDDFFAYCIAIVVFFAMMKFIKMLRFNNRMSALSKTLTLCAKDLSGFFVFFMITFMAFGQLFYLFFSMHLLYFQSYLSTIESMFSIMLNRFEYKEFVMAQPFVGPTIFFIFALWSNIILINIFLAIIIISFETIKDDVMKKPNEYDILDFVVRRFKATFGFGAPGGARPKAQVDPNAAKSEEVNGATKELPQKVDRLLEHINVVYFDGKLDLKSKEFLKRKHGRRAQFSSFDPRKADEPLIFQSN